MSLEDVMPSEINLRKKINTICFHIYEVFREVKIIETKRIVVTGG